LINSTLSELSDEGKARFLLEKFEFFEFFFGVDKSYRDLYGSDLGDIVNKLDEFLPA
jgi:hypothetical protein